MDCNKCEYYSEIVISFMDCHGVETDMGIRRVECSERKRELIGKTTVGLGDYTNQKKYRTSPEKHTTTIGIIKFIDCPDNIKHIIPKTYYSKDTPKWCPKKKIKKI